MDVVNYYYIYSTMTQVTGALIALVAIFIIFRIEIQSKNIAHYYEVLGSMMFGPDATINLGSITLKPTSAVTTDEIEKKYKEIKSTPNANKKIGR